MSRPKSQGTAWETEIVNLLRVGGFDAFRLSEGGQYDLGDVMIPEFGIVVEAKDRSQISLHSEVQKANRKTWLKGLMAVVVWKRKERKAGNSRRSQVGEPIVALRLEDFVHILRHLDMAPGSTIKNWRPE